MCGITGIFNRNGVSVNLAGLISSTRTLVHRGPDEEGYFVNSRGPVPNAELDVPLHTLQGQTRSISSRSEGNAGLGHRRLSIIDLASGQQPLSNEDGTVWVAFNGEIYNFQILKEELEAKGHKFRTNSDTETIVHAYEEWLERSIERFRGMFALALWDENRQQLLLARDRVGKKPLYYLEEKDRFIFASEIKAILKNPDVNRSIDVAALSDYLSLLYVPSPKSIFASIRKLPAAHYAIVTRDSLEVRPYWDLSFAPCHDLTPSQMSEDLLNILQESVRLRMISDVPLGAFLSGGIDSSAVVALMTRCSKEPVITNSISFSVSNYDEIRYARAIAERFSTNYHEFQVTPEAMPIIEKLAWHYDEPFADSSAVPTYYVSKTARESVTVSLSGDGGDENFAGYRRYYFDVRENRVRDFVPTILRKPVFGLLGSLYPKADFLPQVFRGKAFISNVSRDPVDAYFFSMSAFYGDEKRKLLNPDVKNELQDYRAGDLFYGLYRDAQAEDHLSRLQYLDIKTYLSEDILTKVDRASMAVSLEVRCPLLDHVFMEYVARIPARLKLVGAKGKHIFKEALSNHLPHEVLYRKKMGFAVPILEWLRGDLKGYAREKILDGKATRVFLQRNYLERLWNQHQIGIRDRSRELWTVMMLNLWYDRFASEELLL